jgi:hypothetical protein
VRERVLRLREIGRIAISWSLLFKPANFHNKNLSKTLVNQPTPVRCPLFGAKVSMHNLRVAKFILGIETSDIPSGIFTSQAMISSPKTTVLPQAMVFKINTRRNLKLFKQMT